MISRRSFCTALAYAGVAIAALAWDAGVNGGKPAEAEEDDEEGERPCGTT